MDLVTLKTFDSYIHAYLLKSKLENEGIESYIYDEHIVTMNWGYNLAVGGIKLKVMDKDYKEAFDILEALDATAYLDDESRPIKCSGCGSYHFYTNYKIVKGVRGILTTIISFMTMAFLAHYKAVYKCKECGREIEHF